MSNRCFLLIIVAELFCNNNMFECLIYIVTPDETMCPPDFTTRLVDTVINDGQPLELTCKVTGDPEPQITWFKNGKVIAQNIYFLRLLKNRH